MDTPNTQDGSAATPPNLPYSRGGTAVPNRQESGRSYSPPRIGGARGGRTLEKKQPTQYLQPLVAAGLEPDQAQVYELLLKNGPLKAGKVAQKSTLKRGLIYKILEELVEVGLVIKNEPLGKIAIFEPAHPLKVKEFAEAREAKLKTAQLSLDGILGNLTSDYNLALGKPGIQFYEGKEGVAKVANDSLTSKTEILSYLDNEAINKYIPDINKEYIQKRNRMKIVKKMISVDSQYVRDRAKQFNKSTTQIRVIEKGYPFATVMQIYDGKVSYITLDEKKMIGVIIADPHIYQMHKILFDFTWEKSKPLVQLIPAPALA